MTDTNNFIDEMTNDILNQKRALDMPIFLNFLKEELENAGITLTIKRYRTPIVNGNHIVTSDIAGIQLDLTEHDREKDIEIEKYKKAFESAKCERDKAVCEYRNEIDRLTAENAELHCEMQAMNVYREELPFEPIEIAQYLINRTMEVKNTFPALQGGEISYMPVHGDSELRQIAEHLLVHCKYHSEEQ